MPERDFQADLDTCRRASGGTWFGRDNGGGEATLHHREEDGTFRLALFNGWDKNKENCDFAAASRTGWPAALEALLALQRRERVLTEALSDALDIIHGRPGGDCGLLVCPRPTCQRLRAALQPPTPEGGPGDAL